MEILNLAWHDAIAVRQVDFSDSERAAGWPKSMRVEPLATLQRPWPAGDAQGMRRRGALLNCLIDACKSGHLEHTTTIKKVLNERGAALLMSDSISDDWLERDGVLSTCQPSQYHTEKPVYHLTPQAFAAWLASQREEPSVHIKSWLAASGVVTAQAVQVIAPEAAQAVPPRKAKRDLLAPLIEAAQRQCTDPTDAPAIWLILSAQAEKAVRPFIGVSDDGLKWMDANDDPQFFRLKHLRDRIRIRPKAPQKTALRRVK